MDGHSPKMDGHGPKMGGHSPFPDPIRHTRPAVLGGEGMGWDGMGGMGWGEWDGMGWGGWGVGVGVGG